VGWGVDHQRPSVRPRGRDDAQPRVADQGVPQRLASAAGLPRIRLHDLRHSYAGSALAAGVPIEVLSRRLGHSCISITQDVYVHTNERQDREATNLAARAVLGG
jgi:integrase